MGRRRHRPDVSHTLRMWLWLTFHLPAWPAASHPSLSSHLPVRMSAVFLDTASAPRRRPRFPRPLTICGRPLPLVHLRGAEIRPATRLFQPTSGKEAAYRFRPCEFEMATSLCLLPKDSVCNKSNKSVFLWQEDHSIWQH